MFLPPLPKPRAKPHLVQVGKVYHCASPDGRFAAVGATAIEAYRFVVDLYLACPRH